MESSIEIKLEPLSCDIDVDNDTIKQEHAVLGYSEIKIEVKQEIKQDPLECESEKREICKVKKEFETEHINSNANRDDEKPVTSDENTNISIKKEWSPNVTDHYKPLQPSAGTEVLIPSTSKAEKKAKGERKTDKKRKDGKTFSCRVCFKYFNSNAGLLMHIYNSKGPPGMPFKCKKKRTKPNIFYYCHTCMKGYRYKQHLIRHLQVHLKCRFCRQVLQSPNDLEVHLETHKSIKCTFCESTFHTPSILREHIKNVHGEKPFCCEICLERFSSHCSLSSHKKGVHGNVRPHVCTICEKAFRTKAKLKNHGAVHSDQRDFECNLCLKRYKNIDRLNVHIKTVHLSERQECDVCKREYSTKQKLREHRMLHSETPPQFVCDVCKKVFTYKNSLKNHMLVHSGERPHTCKQCGKSFALKSNLTVHVRNVHLSQAGSGIAIFL